MSEWQKRATPSGFVQFREGTRGRWRYQIFGFTGEPGAMGTARMMTADGSRDVPIDAKNRILIDGRWRSPTSWNH